MIIAFDGNVFVGKTSLVRALALILPAIMIDEHSEFLSAHTLSHIVTAEDVAVSLQSKYLIAEEKRCAYLKEGKINLLDRSFVSMSAHVFALNRISGIDIREEFLRGLQKKMESGKVVIPDVFYFVKCDHETIRGRISENSSKNTDPIYYTGEYLDAIEYFNKAWSGKIGGITIDTEAALPIRLAETLVSQISVAGQGSFSIQNICSFLREILI